MFAEGRTTAEGSTASLPRELEMQQCDPRQRTGGRGRVTEFE